MKNDRPRRSQSVSYAHCSKQPHIAQKNVSICFPGISELIKLMGASAVHHTEPNEWSQLKFIETILKPSYTHAGGPCLAIFDLHLRWKWHWRSQASKSVTRCWHAGHRGTGLGQEFFLGELALRLRRDQQQQQQQQQRTFFATILMRMHQLAISAWRSRWKRH